MSAGSAPHPRILVTGFGSFPGVPANPTAALIEALRLRPDAAPTGSELFSDVLHVSYRALPARLAELGRRVRPDIAIHFGVSGRATSFAVETLARNRVCTAKPDEIGYVPTEPVIRPGQADLPSSLPAERLVRVLESNGMPAVLSDDAGDYLCNFAFYLSAGGHCPGFAPSMAGFIHVPPFGTVLGEGRAFDLAMLTRGARLLIETCAAEWRHAQTKKAAPVGAA